MGRIVKLYEEFLNDKNLSDFKDELKMYFEDEYNKIIKIIDNIHNENEIKNALEKIAFLINGEKVSEIESNKINDNFWKNVVALYIDMDDLYSMTIIYDTIDKKFILNSSAEWMDDNVELFTDNI